MNTKTTIKYRRSARVYRDARFDSLEDCIDGIQTRTVPSQDITVTFDTLEDAIKPLKDELELISLTKVTTIEEPL